MLREQHARGPSVSTSEVTKVFLAVMMITGAISFAYAMGAGTTTSPATTQSSEAAGAASASAAADTGTAEIEALYDSGKMNRQDYDEAMDWLGSIQDGAITAGMIASADLDPSTKVLLYYAAGLGFGLSSLVKLI